LAFLHYCASAFCRASLLVNVPILVAFLAAAFVSYDDSHTFIATVLIGRVIWLATTALARLSKNISSAADLIGRVI